MRIVNLMKNEKKRENGGRERWTDKSVDAMNEQSSTSVRTICLTKKEMKYAGNYMKKNRERERERENGNEQVSRCIEKWFQ